jgi:hypothetical protein
MRRDAAPLQTLQVDDEVDDNLSRLFRPPPERPVADTDRVHV